MNLSNQESRVDANRRRLRVGQRRLDVGRRNFRNGGRRGCRQSRWDGRNGVLELVLVSLRLQHGGQNDEKHLPKKFLGKTCY